eukprot:CAMPEP_0206282904 /NCGR_PEP_ID=MMETSP0047_2-20121206/39939_1 /ASSEMBLY_ACC=CAM_ASM_000192 /TAXON_ID=195065 /ORGANISM="Chroomonas mesostigmatica_cf, Strain CCMP1168" /LENGTH=80 /DNA_ID=CAMNT_0053713221 /DNA_START=71 /DNA_END=310 /DNA_ORIENTATION=-
MGSVVGTVDIREAMFGHLPIASPKASFDLPDGETLMGDDEALVREIGAILREIMNTEKSYVRSLQIAIQFFYEPMLRMSQ